MKGTPWKMRGAAAERAEIELRIRQAMHQHIRQFHPDIPKPPGAGWLIMNTGTACNLCSGSLYYANIPGVDLDDLVACPDCGYAQCLDDMGRDT